MEVEYRVLATNKTSTMEKELNEAADAGFRFQQAMGGETAIGGNEVVAVMSRTQKAAARYSYKLLATSKTSTMEKEMQAAADVGFGTPRPDCLRVGVWRRGGRLHPGTRQGRQRTSVRVQAARDLENVKPAEGTARSRCGGI